MSSDSSNIPRARAILQEALKHHDCADYPRAIRMALKLMTRSSPVRRAPNKEKTITKAKVLHVKAYAAMHPEKTYQEIAVVCKLANGGRVSDILKGDIKGI